MQMEDVGVWQGLLPISAAVIGNGLFGIKLHSFKELSGNEYVKLVTSRACELSMAVCFGLQVFGLQTN